MLGYTAHATADGTIDVLGNPHIFGNFILYFVIIYDEFNDLNELEFVKCVQRSQLISLFNKSLFNKKEGLTTVVTFPDKHSVFIVLAETFIQSDLDCI